MEVTGGLLTWRVTWQVSYWASSSDQISARSLLISTNSRTSSLLTTSFGSVADRFYGPFPCSEPRVRGEVCTAVSNIYSSLRGCCLG